MTKRGIDACVGTVLSVITLPLVSVLALGSAVSFRASPLFVQRRVGRHGKHIHVVKLRSLPAAAGASLDKYQLHEIATTRFGRFLRRSHLDELPQLWLVAIGTMSLVGPRPEMPHLAARFSPEQAAARHAFRPGCVGLWQASNDRGGLMHETPVYDLVYAQHAGLGTDLHAITSMVRVLAGRQGIDRDELLARYPLATSPAPLGRLAVGR